MNTSPPIREPGGKHQRQNKQLLFSKQRAFLRPLPSASNCCVQPGASKKPADAYAKNADSGLPWQGTVLFVSDDDYFRATARAYLEHVGLSVRSCADPTRVPDLFFRKPAIDLLLVDIHAIGTAGLPLAAELAAFTADLPVIIISAPNGGNSASAAMPNRSWKILSKPVLLPELLEAIHAALGRKSPLKRWNRWSSPIEDDEAAARQNRRTAVSGQEQRAAGRPPRLLLMQGTT